MSLLSTFLISHLLPSLEKSLESHEPQIQEEILNEIESLGSLVVSWVFNRLDEHKNKE